MIFILLKEEKLEINVRGCVGRSLVDFPFSVRSNSFLFVLFCFSFEFVVDSRFKQANEPVVKSNVVISNPGSQKRFLAGVDSVLDGTTVPAKAASTVVSKTIRNDKSSSGSGSRTIDRSTNYLNSL